jgi:hypothetical protein
MTNQMTVFPEPAIESKIPISDICARKGEERRTVTINPQKGTSRLPFVEDGILKEPLAGSLVMSVPRGVMILGWVWGRQPCPKTVTELVSCKDAKISRRTVVIMKGHERLEMRVVL